MKPKASRPTGVTLVIIYEVLTGAYAAVGTSLSLYFVQLGAISYSSDLVEYSGAHLLFAVATLGVVWGNLKRKEWSWVGALLLQGLSILIIVGPGNGYGPTNGGEWIVLGTVSLVAIVISLTIIYYFTRPHVQAYFGREAPSLGIASSDNLE